MYPICISSTHVVVVIVGLHCGIFFSTSTSTNNAASKHGIVVFVVYVVYYSLDITTSVSTTAIAITTINCISSDGFYVDNQIAFNNVAYKVLQLLQHLFVAVLDRQFAGIGLFMAT